MAAKQNYLWFGITKYGPGDCVICNDNENNGAKKKTVEEEEDEERNWEQVRVMFCREDTSN